MKFFSGVIAAASFASLLCAPAAFAQTYTLNVNTSQANDDPMYQGLLAFKEAVEKRSAGKIIVKTFSGSSLGSDEDVMEQARAGAGVAVIIDGARLAPYVKEFGIITAPYIAKDIAEMRKVVVSPLFEEWSKTLAKKSGFQVFSYNWYQGDRHLLTNKPVSVPADLTGVRMRTINAPLWLETVRSLGATPTPMPWAEVYSALQLKAIDAAEAQLPSVYGTRLYEVISHVTKTGHIQLVTGMVGSKAWFDKLPADLQTIVMEEALKAGDFASKMTIDNLARYESEIKSKGVTVTEIDKTPFIEATAVVYEKMGYTEIRKQIDAILQK